MVNLETRYLGLRLSNPIVVGSSGLTKNVDKMKACEQAGAGAVVVKSLFEEVLAREDYGVGGSTEYHTEAYDYLRAQLEMQYGPRDYCRILEDAKKSLTIPVIASINCVSAKWWPSYAVQLESAGADALELNVYPMPVSTDTAGATIENSYYDIAAAVRDKVKIPVAIKISPGFTSLPQVAAELCRRGADGLVLFNRFTEPDIDINNLKLKTTFHFSSQRELHLPLRWIALLHGKVDGDLAASTGVHSTEGLIKLLLAGASAVQIASVLYQNGLGKIEQMVSELGEWMEQQGLQTLDQVIGRLSFARTETPDHYLRAQFIETIRGVE